jgi:hypothetical protein
VTYEIECLDADWDDDGTMPENVAELEKEIVGHRIVKATKGVELPHGSVSWGRATGLELTLDNGKRVFLVDTDDCCAYTQLESFLLHPEMVDHLIMGVGTTGKYTTWHIYADMGDVLELSVQWSCGNPFYYGYGFSIRVFEVE